MQFYAAAGAVNHVYGAMMGTTTGRRRMNRMRGYIAPGAANSEDVSMASTVGTSFMTV